MNLSDHFTLAELTATETGLDNTPEPTQIMNLQWLANEVLEPIRAALGGPVYVTSGFRSEDVNQAVGGSEDSYHMLGLAADIKCKAGQDKLWDAVLRSGAPIDQAILYRDGRSHIHVGASARPRGQLLVRTAGGHTPWSEYSESHTEESAVVSKNRVINILERAGYTPEQIATIRDRTENDKPVGKINVWQVLKKAINPAEVIKLLTVVVEAFADDGRVDGDEAKLIVQAALEIVLD